MDACGRHGCSKPPRYVVRDTVTACGSMKRHARRELPGVYEVSLPVKVPRADGRNQGAGLESAYEYDGKAVYWAVNCGSHRAIRSRFIGWIWSGRAQRARDDQRVLTARNLERSAFIVRSASRGIASISTVWGSERRCSAMALVANSRSPSCSAVPSRQAAHGRCGASYALANPKPGRADQWVERGSASIAWTRFGRLTAVWNDSQGICVPAVAAREARTYT